MKTIQFIIGTIQSSFLDVNEHSKSWRKTPSQMIFGLSENHGWKLQVSFGFLHAINIASLYILQHLPAVTLSNFGTNFF